MSKRLVRIAGSKLFKELEKLHSREVSAVLENGNTYSGRLESYDNVSLRLKDSRDHTHNLAFAELYELVYDAAQPN